MPVADEKSRKPVLFHGIRVGTYLYEKAYSQDIVIAGLLHDVLEDTDVKKDLVQELFGEHVVSMVLACTKDDSILDKHEKIQELIRRCVSHGEEALIVKSADILDSFKWYESQDNKEEIMYCMRNANAILLYKPEEYTDKIFTELTQWQSKHSDSTQ
jgi:(p)ppGpp synthase/HD superfamily hydrolase